MEAKYGKARDYLNDPEEMFIKEEALIFKVNRKDFD